MTSHLDSCFQGQIQLYTRHHESRTNKIDNKDENNKIKEITKIQIRNIND
jgi:hypothetical protein